jgi:hypothetical protein
MYYLTVTLNYSTYTKEVSLPDTPLSQRQMMEIAQGYLNDPDLTSAIFTVVRIPSHD